VTVRFEYCDSRVVGVGLDVAVLVPEILTRDKSGPGSDYPL